MAITASNSEIIKSARRIKTNPSVVSVKALKFNKKQDYSKFIKWIDSSNKELEKIKLPKKKDIKGISVKGSGGINLLGLAALAALGVGGLIASGKLDKFFEKIDIDFGGDGKGEGGPPGSGVIKTATTIGGGIAGIQLLKRTPLAKNALKSAKTALTSNRWVNRFFNPMNKAKNKIVKTGGLLNKSKNISTLGKLKGGLRLSKTNVVTNTLAGGIDYGIRRSEGQTQTQAISGAASGVAGGIAGAALGAKAGTAAGAAIGALFGGVGAVPGAAIGGVIGGLLGGFGGASSFSAISDKITGVGSSSNQVQSNITFGNIMDKFENVVIKFESMNFTVTSKASSNSRNKKNEQKRRNATKQSLRDMDIGFTDPVTGKDNYDLKLDKGGGENQWWDFMDLFPNPDVYKVIPKENKVSNMNLNKDQVIVMVPEGMQPPSGGGIVPIPIPTGGGGSGNIIMNNSSDDVNTIASNLLLTKLAV